MDRASEFYSEIFGLPTALDARILYHAEAGPNEPLARIGSHATGKKWKSERRTGIVFGTDDIYTLCERLK